MTSEAEPIGYPDDSSRRARILRAATNQFATRGFSAARIEDVAAEADVNRALIYYYFDSKAGLYDAVNREMIRAFLPRMELPDGLSLTQIFDWELNRHDSDEGVTMLHLLAWEGVEDRQTPANQQLERERTERVSAIARAISAAKDRGELPVDADPGIVALLLMFAVAAPVALPQVTRMVTGLQVDDPALHDRIATTLHAIIGSIPRRRGD